jgi:hypothetical protein
MSDDKSKTGTDRRFISLSEDYERRDWAESLGVSEERLEQAVRAVGNSVEDVRKFLDEH